jgi:hypothetical protein
LGYTTSMNIRPSTSTAMRKHKLVYWYLSQYADTCKWTLYVAKTGDWKTPEWGKMLQYSQATRNGPIDNSLLNFLKNGTSYCATDYNITETIAFLRRITFTL